MWFRIVVTYLLIAFSPVWAADKIEQGKQLYNKNCSACHGDNGNTAVWARGGLNPPPRDFTSDAAREELSRERMITSVTYGRPGTAMMPFAKRLNADEIETVVDFIRLKFMQPPINDEAKRKHVPSSPISTANTASVFPNGLKGNAGNGREFFLNNCYVCHGKTGEGNGPRAHFNYPRPRDFTSDDTRRNFDRSRLFNSVKNGKPGTVMPAWGKVLSDQQIADVAEFVFTAFISPTDKKKH